MKKKKVTFIPIVVAVIAILSFHECIGIINTAASNEIG